jgi:hypothetical protein
MKIIGQATPVTGEHRKRDFALEAARRRANLADKKISAHGVSITSGANDAVAVAASAVQKSFASLPNATVSIGKPSQDYYDRTTKV